MPTYVAQGQEFLQLAALALLSIAQSTVICGGLAAGLAVCVQGVARGTLTVGDTVCTASHPVQGGHTAMVSAGGSG
jgi:ABC-type transport system involved in Fe-S cluster assembly fused permease/ATPase subunit